MLSFVSRVATALHLSTEKIFLADLRSTSTPRGIWTGPHPPWRPLSRDPSEIPGIKKPKGISKVKPQRRITRRDQLTLNQRAQGSSPCAPTIQPIEIESDFF